MLVGRMDEAMSTHRKAFGMASHGFFLDSLQGSAARSEVPQELCNEVSQYNQCLDLLSLLTMGPLRGLDTGWKKSIEEEEAEALEGVLSNERFTAVPAQDKEYLAEHGEGARRFHDTLAQIHTIERHAHDKGGAHYGAFALQEQLIPHIGTWSAERRRILRNQVFLAGQHIAAAEQYRPEPDRKAWQAVQDLLTSLPKWLPLAVCGGLLVYIVAMYALIWGADWVHRGLVMIFASLLVLFGLILTITCSALNYSSHIMDILELTGAAGYVEIPPANASCKGLLGQAGV